MPGLINSRGTGVGRVSCLVLGLALAVVSLSGVGDAPLAAAVALVSGTLAAWAATTGQQPATPSALVVDTRWARRVLLATVPGLVAAAILAEDAGTLGFVALGAAISLILVAGVIDRRKSRVRYVTYR